MQDWKDILGATFGVELPNEGPSDEQENAHAQPTDALTAQGKQVIDILLDRKQRRGKTVTLATNFRCSDEQLRTLATELKQQCGSGGSARGGEILIQGDFRQKVNQYLSSKGYKTRII